MTHRLCALGDLDGVRSRRVPLPASFRGAEGFVVHAGGGLRAYVNVCPHRGQPVDLGDGKLFVGEGVIECQAHGARFDAASGACLGGPCRSDGLRALAVVEQDGALYLAEAEREPPVDDEWSEY